MLMLPYISNKCDRRIRNLISKTQIPCQLISKPNVTLSKFLDINEKTKSKCQCEICEQVGTKYHCESTCVVYSYTCKICGDKYIGKTARPFISRHREHSNAIKNANNSSALSVHLSLFHKDQPRSVKNFDISFLCQKKTSLAITIEECKYIENLKPRINRKHELNNYPLITESQNHQNVKAVSTNK